MIEPEDLIQEVKNWALSATQERQR